MSVEKSVCPLQWDYVCTRINSKQHTMCCHSPWHDVTKDELDSNNYDNLVNSEPIRRTRLEMLKGNRPSSCNICWKLEDRGVESFRQIMSKYMPERVQYLIDHAHEAVDINSPILYSNNPTFLEIHLGNTCDLKCIYCGPEWSSQWALEKLQNKKITEAYYKKISINPSTEYSDMLWNYVETKGKNSLEKIGFIGGEPLTSPDFQPILNRLLDIFKDAPPHTIKIWIVTNLNANAKYFDKFMELLPRLTERFKVEIGISMESTGEQAEYIRHGLNWSRFEQNVYKLFTSTKDSPNMYITFKSTISAPSVPSIKRFIEWTNKLQQEVGHVRLGFTMISSPAHQSPLVLPPEYSKYINDAVDILDDPAYKQSLMKIRDSMANSTSNDNLKKTFYKWFKENDETRNTNFVEVFPELKEFYESCSKL